MIVLIDNYDSFVHNLARYFTRLGQRTQVVRNDAITCAEIRDLAPAALILSPGPCAPDQAGISLDVVREFCGQIPLLGVCLGHQAIAAALGSRIVRAVTPVHGRASLIRHDGQGVFAGVTNPLRVGRYHSLVVDPTTFPDCLQASAWTDDGTLMALAHREFPVVGVQFHPESILTEAGYEILAGFLRVAGIARTGSLPTSADEGPAAGSPLEHLPKGPVTF